MLGRCERLIIGKVPYNTTDQLLVGLNTPFVFGINIILQNVFYIQRRREVGRLHFNQADIITLTGRNNENPLVFFFPLVRRNEMISELFVRMNGNDHVVMLFVFLNIFFQFQNIYNSVEYTVVIKIII